MIKSLFCLCFLFLSYSIAAQTNKPKFSVPTEYSLVDSIDYKKYEPQVLEAIDWYLWRSLAFDKNERSQVKEFFMKWIAGSPTVTVAIDGNVVSFMNTSPELLMPFLMGWTKYSLDNNYSKNNIKCCIAAIRATTKFYDDNRSFFIEDETIENYKKMNDKKLEKYLKKTTLGDKPQK